MKTCFMVIASLCVTLICNAQQIKALKVGDQFPDMTFSKVINAPYTEIPYASMKNKVVVLDFFATWCSSCIALFPHLDSLKAKYGDQLEIFIVSREPRGKVEQMLKTKPIAKGFKLPFIIEDSTLYKLYPHSFIPHEVVLKSGKVAAITYPEFINEKTVGSLLDGQEVDLPIKCDIKYDRLKSIYENQIGHSLDLTVKEFLFTKHIDGLSSIGGIVLSSDSSLKRIVNINRPLLSLIMNAANLWNHRNRVILNVTDSTKFFKTGVYKYNWLQNNTYGLEYVVPTKWNWTEINDWVLQQLNVFLDYRIYKQERLVDCWVLTRANNGEKVSRGTAVYNKQSSIISGVVFNGTTQLVNALNTQVLTDPFVPIVLDEVQDSSIIITKLKDANMHNLQVVSERLRPYGLMLKPAQRMLEMLVIEDKRNSAK